MNLSTNRVYYRTHAACSPLASLKRAWYTESVRTQWIEPGAIGNYESQKRNIPRKITSQNYKQIADLTNLGIHTLDSKSVHDGGFTGYAGTAELYCEHPPAATRIRWLPQTFQE